MVFRLSMGNRFQRVELTMKDGKYVAGYKPSIAGVGTIAAIYDEHSFSDSRDLLVEIADFCVIGAIGMRGLRVTVGNDFLGPVEESRQHNFGEVQRVNPEQPAAHLVKIINEEYILGGAANVASNISSLGANCCLYGTLGEDSYKNEIKRLCNEKKIILRDFLKDGPTIIKQRVIAHGQQIVRLDFGENNLKKMGESIENQIITSLEKEMEEYDFIILSDYNKSFFSKSLSETVINMANSKNINSLVDPKPCNLEFFKGCTVVCPNRYEAEKITGIKYSNEWEILKKMGEVIFEKIGANCIIITCGEDGVFIYDKYNQNSSFIEAQVREIADVTGAGDTFAAVLSLGLSSKLDIYDSSKLANYAAGIVVKKVGTATLNINELRSSIKK